jgi:ADP-ribose pyrophosphatase YjhB (NUDIX family)
MKENKFLVVVIAVIRNKNHFLIVKKAKDPGLGNWEFPQQW